MVAAIFALWFLCLFEIATAEFNLGGEQFSGFALFSWESQYVFSIGIKASKHPHFSQEFSLSHDGSGAYIGASFSESPSPGLDGRDDKEFNAGLIRRGWKHNFNMKFSHIRITDAGPLNELSLQVDSSEHPFYYKGSYLIALWKNSPSSGFFNRVGTIKSFSVSLWRGYDQVVTLEGYVGGTIGGALGIKSGFTHAAATVSFPIPLIGSVELTPKFGYQFTFPGYRGTGKGDISNDNPKWGMLTLKYKF